MVRLLFLILLAYFVFRAARNLWRAVKAERPPQALDPAGPWNRPSERLDRSGWREEVEEARYRDL